MPIKIHFPDIVSSLWIASLREEIDTFSVGRPHGRKVIPRVIGELGEVVSICAYDINVGVPSAAAGTNYPFAVGGELWG